MQAPSVKIVVTAQVGDNEPFEIATADAPITIGEDGIAYMRLGSPQLVDTGGWLVQNKTGKPERILNDAQWGEHVGNGEPRKQ